MKSEITSKVLELLSKGPKSTAEIEEYVNNNLSSGTTTQQLCNVLGKNPHIIKLGYVKRKNNGYGNYLICEWGLKDQTDISLLPDDADVREYVIGMMCSQPMTVSNIAIWFERDTGYVIDPIQIYKEIFIKDDHFRKHSTSRVPRKKQTWALDDLLKPDGQFLEDIEYHLLEEPTTPEDLHTKMLKDGYEVSLPYLQGVLRGHKNTVVSLSGSLCELSNYRKNQLAETPLRRAVSHAQSALACSST